MSNRIQARAIRRAGELLNTLDGRPQNAAKQSDGTGTLFSRKEAGSEAGMSKRQQVTAVRVANVPQPDFDAAVEAEHDENEVRKALLVSEAVALASAIEREMGERRGRPSGDGDIRPDWDELQRGERTDEIVARKVGFGSKDTYRRAKLVVEHGAPNVVEAMNKGEGEALRR